MTWFERLMGFAETSPEQVRESIDHVGDFLVSKVNGQRVRCGRLTMPSLAELRERSARDSNRGCATVSEVVGDAAQLHLDRDNAGALFQAASQFNLLEMAGPSVTPEEGVGIYEFDRTQGPACAVACGGGTILRNYFVDVGGQLGQTAGRQVDCAAELLAALGGDRMWNMKNGYALPSEEGLQHAGAQLAAASEQERDNLRGLLRVGVQHDVEVLGPGHIVTQVYGSGLPVNYGGGAKELWEPVARLVLEASYEATVLVAEENNINTIYLTLLGGGVFGNELDWIADALLRAVDVAGPLDIRIVSYGQSNARVQQIVNSRAAVGESR